MLSTSDGPVAAAAAQLERRIEALQVEASRRAALSLDEKSTIQSSSSAAAAASTTLSRDEKSMIAAGQSSWSAAAAAASTATALMPNDIVVPHAESSLDGNSRFVPEPFVRVHVELDVSAPFPLQKFHGSYRNNDGVGEAIPVMATNDQKLHAEVMGFEYQPLGGRLHIDEKVVDELTEMIASRYVLTYKKEPRDIWMKHVTGYTRMDTDATTYAKQCLEGEVCPWDRFQGVFGRTRSSILPLLDRNRHKIPQEWPASDSFFGVNKALSDYVIMIALQCWSHINRCWMESTAYPCVTQHLLVLHDEDFRSESLPSDDKWPDDRKWANLSGAAILEAARTLSLVQFVELLHLCTGHTCFRVRFFLLLLRALRLLTSRVL